MKGKDQLRWKYKYSNASKYFNVNISTFQKKIYIYKK